LFGIFIIIIVVAISIVVFVNMRYRINKSHLRQSSSLDYDLKNISIEDIDQMEDGSEFEMYLYRLFIELGYSGVYKTVGSRDFGADIVFTDREGVRNVVQAKRYAIDNSVGISAVQAVFSCMRYYKAKRAIVITTSNFTEPCETLAGINHVKLLDRKDLILILEGFKRNEIQKVKDVIEAEPRMILESWSEVDNFVLQEFRKDYKAEKFLQKVSLRK